MRFAYICSLLAALGPWLAAARGDARPAGEMDAAVARALAFLQRTQDASGAWRAGNDRNPAVTSLCVMAFLSAGHVPGEGRYGDTVTRGIRWVLQVQQPNGLLAANSGHEMYHHGICTLMLAEAAGMTDGPLAEEVRRKLEKAVLVILKAQRKHGTHRGGWRYTLAGDDGDISVTGWQLMALRAAKNLGCDVPPECIDAAVAYIKRCRDPISGGFCYYPGSHVTIPCTGTSILGLEICGKDQHHAPEALRGGAFLLKAHNLPRYKQAYFFYSVYYCAQATFQLGDNYWSYYRPHLHTVLFRNQLANGSWVGGSGESRYGPNYCTAMAVLALTVEYRLLPIYQRGDDAREGDARKD